MKSLTPYLAQKFDSKLLLTLAVSFILSLTAYAGNNKAYTCTTTITVTPGNSTICSGSSITLTASGSSIASWSWSDAETTAAITVSPTITTTYIVSAIDSNGCTASDTILITVDNPIVSATSSQNLICPGGNTTLNTSISGGTSPYTYVWSPTSWLSCSTCASPTANPTGTISYNVTTTDANGCSSSTSVTVNVDNILVSTNATPQGACIGSNVVLNATVLGGAAQYTYLWSPGGGTGVSDSIVASVTQTTYTFSVTDSNGCSASATASVNPDNLTVYLPPTMSICASAGSAAGLADQLYAQTSGGVQPYTYAWSTGNTNAWQFLAGLSSGTYSVSVIDANGCTSTSSVILTVNSPPIITIAASANSIESGDNDTLTASGGVLYFWSTGQTGSQIIVHPNSTTGYSVFGMDSNYCSSSIGTTVIITRDYWLPSPDTTIHHLKDFPPIYFSGNVSIGGDSAYSPHHSLEVHGNAMMDSALTVAGTVKAGKEIIGSGITAPGNYGLYVGNGILASQVKIALPTDTNWSDYVFGSLYKLKTLSEVDQYIKVNKHLPDVPSAQDVQKSGIDVANMDATLLKKIEELTLYMIQQQQQSQEQQKEIQNLKAQLESLKKTQK